MLFNRVKPLYITIVLVLFFAMILAGCGSKVTKEDNTNDANTASEQANNQTNEAAPKESNITDEAPVTTSKNKEGNQNPLVMIEMENGDVINVELYPDIAPNTVNNFISLVKSGFYDGLIFHRVIPGFMIQGGDPLGLGYGGPGYGIKGEFNNNDFENNLSHERGVISMARSDHPDSAGSQFFIVVEDSSFLDGNYAAFGKVLSGMEAADTIVNVERNLQNDKPEQDQVMKKVKVNTFGVDYPEPEVIK